MGELRPFVQWTKEAQRTPGRDAGLEGVSKEASWAISAMSKQNNGAYG